MTFRRAPLAAAAVWFGAGILLAHFSWIPVWIIVVALWWLCGLIVVAFRFSLRVAWMPIAVLWVIAGIAAAEWNPGPPDTTPLARYSDGLRRRVIGRVGKVQVLPPRPSGDFDTVPAWESTVGESEPEAERAQSIDLELTRIEEITPDVTTMVPVAGGLRITVYGAIPALSCGDLVETNVLLKLPEVYGDPGVWQYADYLRGQGIAAHASIAGPKLRRLSAGTGSWRCAVASARGWAVARLADFVKSRANRNLPGLLALHSSDAAMLDAMLFGDRTGLNHTLLVGFERTGSFHLFVVSGLHVSLLTGGLFWALRRLRTPRWLATGGTITGAFGYAVLTGFGQPVERAFAMTTVFLLARLLIRKGSPANALGAAALAMMVWTPGCIFEASFQMTVLVVVAIAGLAVPIGERSVVASARAASPNHHSNLKPKQAQFRTMLQLWGDVFAGAFGRWSRGIPARSARWTLWLLELALVGVAAELVMVLPMAIYFHRAAVFALPANLVVIPVLALLAPAAVATFAAALVSPWAAVVPGAVTASLLHGVAWVIGRLSGLGAADVRVPGPVWWVGVGAVVVWAGCCWAVRRGRWGVWLTIIALPIVAMAVLWPEAPVVTRDRLELTAIDVGQGDSLLVVAPDGHTMLVDAGGPVGQHGVAEVTTGWDMGEEVVSPYLWWRRLRRLDVVVLTHAHSDHMGGMPAVLKNFRPRELWVGIDPSSKEYEALLDEAARLGIAVRHLRAGDGLEWGGTRVSVLSPSADYGNPGAPKNDDSVVMRMEYGLASVLLEGDAEKPSERAMLESGNVRPVTVLKVGHHGSATSTSEAFLAATRPRDAVVSVGRGNTFGHPRSEVIGRIAASGARLYRTDMFGLTTFLLSRDGGVETVTGAR